MHLIYHEKYHMMLVLMRKSICNASYPIMHIVRLILSVIIKPVQPTYHQVNIDMPAYMIIHATNPKVNANPNTWRMLWTRGGKK